MNHLYRFETKASRKLVDIVSGLHSQSAYDTIDDVIAWLCENLDTVDEEGEFGPKNYTIFFDNHPVIKCLKDVKNQIETRDTQLQMIRDIVE